jgi:hypothetical protein
MSLVPRSVPTAGAASALDNLQLLKCAVVDVDPAGRRRRLNALRHFPEPRIGRQSTTNRQGKSTQRSQPLIAKT